MKKTAIIIVVLVSFLLIAGCGGRWAANPQLSPEQQRVSTVSDTSKCQFIKADYVEVAAAYRMNYFVTIRTLEAGGDSYKILATGNERVSGMNLVQVNFEIYKCKP